MPLQTEASVEHQATPNEPESWESRTIREIGKLHDQATALAYELGQHVASEGREKRARFDVCEPLDNAFLDGWNDYMGSQP